MSELLKQLKLEANKLTEGYTPEWELWFGAMSKAGTARALEVNGTSAKDGQHDILIDLEFKDKKPTLDVESFIKILKKSFNVSTKAVDEIRKTVINGGYESILNKKF